MRKTSAQFVALFLSSLFVALFVSSVALPTHADVEREFSVDDFDSVAVSQGINLNLVMGSPSSVTAVADDDSDLDSLEIEVDDGELVIRRGSWVSGLFSMGKSRGSVTVDVVASELQAVASSSGANADLIDITCADLEVDASSGSRIEVSGSCDTVAIDASSGANVDSSDLITADASVDSSSGASIQVFAGESFRGDASSGSSIRVYGSPEVAESETSSGASIDLRSHTQTI
jgi:hypothetical protein